MSDLEFTVCHQEAMCDEDMPAVFQYFTKVSSLPSRLRSFLPSLSLVLFPPRDAFVCLQEALCEEEAGSLDPKDPNRPRFTLQELRDVHPLWSH